MFEGHCPWVFRPRAYILRYLETYGRVHTAASHWKSCFCFRFFCIIGPTHMHDFDAKWHLHHTKQQTWHFRILHRQKELTLYSRTETIGFLPETGDISPQTMRILYWFLIFYCVMLLSVCNWVDVFWRYRQRNSIPWRYSDFVIMLTFNDSLWLLSVSIL